MMSMMLVGASLLFSKVSALEGGDPSLVVKRSPNSITFRATSNDVSPTESARRGVSLLYWIRDSKVFRDAFPSRRSGFRRSVEMQESKKKSEIQKSISKAIIIQSSVSKEPVHKASFGLVSAVMEAYNQHHNLCLRPDDIWQAILTQFSFYVNANGEELRDCFVDFKGKKTLVISMRGSLFSADFGSFAKRMVDEKIATNLKDEEVTEWLLPSFSTTTNDDRIAASVSIMSTLQSYFEYVCRMLCGIPQVTLEGTPDDWRILRQKIDRLPIYDLNGATPGCMTKWHTLLVPVLDEFVASSEGRPRLEFWDKVCSHVGGGSGPSYLSGWITVFACFTAKGEWQGELRDDPPLLRSSHTKNKRGEIVPYRKEWPFLETSKLPVGGVSVPVLVDDNGIQYDAQMLAGQFAFETKTTTVRPRTDWCIAYEGEPKANPRDYKDREIRPLHSDS